MRAILIRRRRSANNTSDPTVTADLLQASFKTTVTSAIVEVKVKRGESINPNDSWPVTTAYKSHHHRRPRIKFAMHIQETGQWRVPNIEERRGGRSKRDATLRNRTVTCSKYRGEEGEAE